MATEEKKKTIAFRVGEQVGVLLGGRVLRAVVIEDRGDLGPGGSHLFRVEVRPKKDADRVGEQFEVPAEALVPA
ncbi:MAG: hypothetical protein ACYC8T_33445 [Myxococcaceae bacterium]